MSVRVMIYLSDPLAHNLWRISELAPGQFPVDEDTDGSRNVGLHLTRLLVREHFTEFSSQEIFKLCNKARTWP
jgi:hypothetical protein